VVWSQGVTEGGSSGGALVTLAPSGGFYEIRGGLFGGVSACETPTEPDYYSHFEQALPLVREYLTPTADMQGKVSAVEFYNAALDHYFLSTNPVEIDNLDSGRTVGWVRTGLRFLVFSVPAAGTSPVCRFYRCSGVRRFALLLGFAGGSARRLRPRIPSTGSTKAPACSTSSCPNTTSGVCPCGNRRRLPLLQHVHHQPPVHDRAGHSRPDESFAALDGRGLRAGAVFPHHVRGSELAR
jgi:hypothetical protein